MNRILILLIVTIAYHSQLFADSRGFYYANQPGTVQVVVPQVITPVVVPASPVYYYPQGTVSVYPYNYYPNAYYPTSSDDSYYYESRGY